jgi:hypothetical protein
MQQGTTGNASKNGFNVPTTSKLAGATQSNPLTILDLVNNSVQKNKEQLSMKKPAYISEDQYTISKAQLQKTYEYYYNIQQKLIDNGAKTYQELQELGLSNTQNSTAQQRVTQRSVAKKSVPRPRVEFLQTQMIEEHIARTQAYKALLGNGVTNIPLRPDSRILNILCPKRTEKENIEMWLYSPIEYCIGDLLKIVQCQGENANEIAKVIGCTYLSIFRLIEDSFKITDAIQKDLNQENTNMLDENIDNIQKFKEKVSKDKVDKCVKMYPDLATTLDNVWRGIRARVDADMDTLRGWVDFAHEQLATQESAAQ